MEKSISNPNEVNLIEKFNLKGKLAFITGSARGIGRATAIGLAELGAIVIVHGSKPTEKLDEALATVKKISPESFSVYGDLSNPTIPDKIIAEIKERARTPDILVLNASVQHSKDWDKITLEESQEQLQVNLISSLRFAQLCADDMKARHWGRIVTIGSVQELRPRPKMAMYAASKSAQENLSRNLAKQLAPFGVTVNNIAPGVFATDRNAEGLANPVVANEVLSAIPSGYCAESADAVGAIALLCSDAGRYFVGANLVIDGGIRLP